VSARRSPASEFLVVLGTSSAVLLWFVYAFTIATPGVLDRAGAVKGWDFPQFYALGRLAGAGRVGDLANGTAIGRAAAESVSPTLATSTFVPVYGPQVALLFRPLASLPYLDALGVWLGVSFVLCVLCSVTLWRACERLHHDAPAVIAMAVGAPVYFFLACYAQLSAVGLALFTLGWLALDRGRPVLAGIALGTLAYKPQLGLAAAVVLLAAAEWPVVGGAVAAAAAQLGVAWLYAGTAVMRGYAHTIMHLGDHITLVEEKRHLLQSLSSFFDLLLPWPRVAIALYVVSTIAALAWTWRIWTSGAPLPLRYSALLVATVLVSPHFYVYDLVILVPAGFFLANAAVDAGHARRPLVACLVLLYVAPLAGAAMAKTFRVQPTAPLLCVLLVMAGQAAFEPRPPRTRQVR
jgi:hypothetical protein